MPFTIGQIDPAKGYVHVFDDTALDIVMSTLDTITDFTAYLTKKEQFLTGNRIVMAAGKEIAARWSGSVPWRMPRANPTMRDAFGANLR